MLIDDVDCVDALYVVCVEERLDVVGYGDCVHVGDVDCVDEWLEVIEDLESCR